MLLWIPLIWVPLIFTFTLHADPPPKTWSRTGIPFPVLPNRQLPPYSAGTLNLWVRLDLRIYLNANPCSVNPAPS